MIGMQHLHINRPGKKLVSIMLCLCLLFFAGCKSPTDLYYAFPNGYAVTRINGHQIFIIYNKDWENEQGQEWDGKIILPNFYVKGFCHNESFIGLFGTHTEASSATDQEIDLGSIQYYLIDTCTNKVLGPYVTQEDFNNACSSCFFGIFDCWYNVSDYPDKWTSSYN